MADLGLDPTVRFVLRGGLSLLLIASATHKLRDPAGFRGALGGYGIVPSALVSSLAAGLMAAELALGASLLTPWFGALPALCTAVLLTVYSAAIALALGRGRKDIDCGCGGSAARVPLRPRLLGRNAGLIGVALAAALPAAARPLEWIDGFTIIGAIAVSALLYGASEIALANGDWGRAVGGTGDSAEDPHAAARRSPFSETADLLLGDLSAARGGVVVAGLVPARGAATRAAAPENRQSLSKGVGAGGVP